MYYEEKGNGRAIVLIHGFSLSSRMWDEQFDAFAKRYRVVRYDMSGYGRSTAPDSVISSSAEVVALLRSLGIVKATLVGMSLGGSVAIRFAIDYPQMVEGVITVSTTLEGFKFSEQLSKRLSSYPGIARDSGLVKAKEAWLRDPFMTPLSNNPALSERIRQIITEWSGIQFSNPLLWSFKKREPPTIRRLDEINVPVLALVGERDGPDMHAIADTLATHITGARKIVVAGSGHLLNLERPVEFNRIVLEFLSGMKPGDK